MNNLFSLIATLFLVLLHLFGHKLHFLEEGRRSKFLSFAGGASLSLIFLELLPQIADMQHQFENDQQPKFLENHLFILALFGIAAYYSMEKAAKLSGNKVSDKHAHLTGAKTNVFRVHVISFSIFNALLGYILVDRSIEDPLNYIFFILVIGLHFMVNDFSLFDFYKERYLSKGRFVVASATFFGWLLGVLTDLPDIILFGVYSFVAGAITLNVLKEELPKEKESDYVAFWMGIIIYSALLLISS